MTDAKFYLCDWGDDEPGRAQCTRLARRHSRKCEFHEQQAIREGVLKHSYVGAGAIVDLVLRWASAGAVDRASELAGLLGPEAKKICMEQLLKEKP